MKNQVKFFLFSIFLAAFSNSGFRVALTWYILKSFGTTALGVSVFATAVTQFLGSFFAGYFTDNYRKELVAVFMNTICAFFLGILVFSTKNQAPFYVLISLYCLSNFSIAIHDNATRTMLPVLVGASDLRSLNGLYIGLCHVGYFSAPVFVGYWMGSAKAWIAMSGMALLCFVASIMLMYVPCKNEPSRKGGGVIKLDLSIFLKNEWLIFGMVSAVIANTFILPFNSILIPSHLNSIGLGSKEFGYFSASLSLGYAVAGFVIKKNRQEEISIHNLLYLLLISVISFLIAFFSEKLIIILACCFTSGLLLANFDISWSSIMQSRSPSNLLGRIYSVGSWTSFAGRSIGIALLGWALSEFGINYAALIGFSGALISIIILRVVVNKKRSYEVIRAFRLPR